MARATTVPINCPDCEQRFDVAVTLHPRSGTDRDGLVLADVKLDEVAFAEEFPAHVMADPENHPTFAMRDDDDADADRP